MSDQLSESFRHWIAIERDKLRAENAKLRGRAGVLEDKDIKQFLKDREYDIALSNEDFGGLQDAFEQIFNRKARG